eukprot:ANDGO_08156.mRNA.1 hypothetical protein
MPKAKSALENRRLLSVSLAAVFASIVLYNARFYNPDPLSFVHNLEKGIRLFLPPPNLQYAGVVAGALSALNVSGVSEQFTQTLAKQLPSATSLNDRDTYLWTSVVRYTGSRIPANIPEGLKKKYLKIVNFEWPFSFDDVFYVVMSLSNLSQVGEIEEAALCDALGTKVSVRSGGVFNRQSETPSLLHTWRFYYLRKTLKLSCPTPRDYVLNFLELHYGFDGGFAPRPSNSAVDLVGTDCLSTAQGVYILLSENMNIPSQSLDYIRSCVRLAPSGGSVDSPYVSANTAAFATDLESTFYISALLAFGEKIDLERNDVFVSGITWTSSLCFFLGIDLALSSLVHVPKYSRFILRFLLIAILLCSSALLLAFRFSSLAVIPWTLFLTAAAVDGGLSVPSNKIGLLLKGVLPSVLFWLVVLGFTCLAAPFALASQRILQIFSVFHMVASFLTSYFFSMIFSPDLIAELQLSSYLAFCFDIILLVGTSFVTGQWDMFIRSLIVRGQLFSAVCLLPLCAFVASHAFSMAGVILYRRFNIVSATKLE